MTAMIQILDTSEAFTLLLTTTSGECGLDTSTDGSDDGDIPTELHCVVYLDHDDRVRTRYRAKIMGATLDDPTPRMMPCPLQAHDVEAAITRLVPWLSTFVAACITDLAHEHEVYAHKGEDMWMRELDERTFGKLGPCPLTRVCWRGGEVQVAPARWSRADPDGGCEMLTLVHLAPEVYAIEISKGARPDEDIVGIYTLDGALIALGAATKWDQAFAPPDAVVAQVERAWANLSPAPLGKTYGQ
jgi:hypothetical protein